MKQLLVVLLGAFLAASAQAKGDADKGKQKAAQVCAACHSADGTKPSAPDQPILAGQYYDYIVQALADYKSGRRNNAIMKGFASGLSKRDMEDVAAWFSSQPTTPLHDQR
jgi:cytochrome c553